MHLNALIFSVAGLVTPCSVSWPTASVGTSPLNLMSVLLKVAVGNLATSNISALLACSSILGRPKLMLSVCTVTSMEPFLASRSSVKVPLDLSNLPRHFDRPPM